MQETNFFLRTKLLPPRSAPEFLKRPRLNERLRSNLSSPVTLLAADAGCGKTTLIAEFLREANLPAVWYQLDHTDADPIVFLNYVAEGIRQSVPGFGQALIAYLADSGDDGTNRSERAADLLINELLKSVEQPIILVLDDYHHLETESPVHKIVDRLLLYASDLLHLIITTRDLPPLAIMRRRTQSDALVIDREDLLFTDDEVRDLFQKTLSIKLDDRQVAEYRERTHGWITALQLVRQIAEKDIAGGRSPGMLDLPDLLKRSEKDIFDYFAEEVFSRENEETRHLLLYLSLLDSLSLDMCSLLFPGMRCSAILPQLAQKNIFLSVAGEGTTEEYRFHPLFRDYLRRRLRSEIGRTALADERTRIAEVLVSAGNADLAMPLFLAAENFERASSLFADYGAQWIRSGAIGSLDHFVKAVPPAMIERYPAAVLHKAEIARLQGDIAIATGLLTQAVSLFHAQGNSLGESEALQSLASLERRRSRPDEALKLLRKAEKQVPQDSETYLKCLNTRGLCLIQTGKWNEAEQLFRVALDLAEKQSNEHYTRLIAHNLALAPGFRGDFGEALRWFARIFREGENDKELPHDAIGHLNVARLLLYRGELAKVETHLERAIDLCQMFNLRSLLPEVLEAYANLYREKSDHAHAIEFYDRALAAYDQAGINLATRELNEERAEFALLRGETIRARALIEDLIESRRPLNNPLSFHTALLCLYRIDLADGRIDGLTDRVNELITFFHQQNRHYDEARSQMLAAETWARLGESKETVVPVQKVLDLSARFDYEYWLLKEIRRNPKLFEFEDIYERLPPDFKRELETAGKTPPLADIDPPSEITDLTVNVLGHVEIFRDLTRPFAPDAWTTRRSRDIFCSIATHKNRRVAKDVLIDTFWGDEELEAVEKNFHPTISHIRKALNSQQAIKQNFIVFRDGAYQLNPELSYRIDTEQFLDHIAGAKKAKGDDPSAYKVELEAAYALYRGEFMEGIYDAWADEPRQFYREQFSRVLNALAKLAVTEKRWNDALRYAAEVLAIDPYREDLHRLTLRVLAAQGKPAAVKKHYESMEQLLKQDLGIAPAAETRKLFREVMK
ncbi:MAG: hypothetical protein KBD94_03020 [Pyrinomonadaceae bacterium]|nr:hypothetical protein [Pyrinomonadaceae bacterium]